MNNRTARCSKHKYQGGAALVEMAIVVLVFFMLVFGILELGRAIFEWSRTIEATRAGVRYAIVNDPACNIFGVAEDSDYPYTYQTCSPGPLACADPGGIHETSMTIDASDCNVKGGNNQQSKEDAACRIVDKPESAGGITVEDRGNMRGIQPLLYKDGAMVKITYACTEVGFAGNAQRIPAVTVEVSGIQYNLVAAGLLGLEVPITLPPFATTRTGEDLGWIPTQGFDTP